MQKQLTDDIIFESRDIEIFNIPDTKTKLNTLQNYFFPRLERLLDMALSLVKEVYRIDPLEKYSFVYRPSHRKDAKINADYNEVYIGIAGRRDVKKQLKIKRPDGKAYSFHPSYLYFKVLPTGEIYVELWPFSHQDEVYVREVKQFLTENYDAFSILLNAGKISYEDGDDFATVVSRLENMRAFWLSSTYHYLPVENQAAIHNLILSFVLLFPILDACHTIAEGATPTFTSHFDNLKTWLINNPEQEIEDKRRKVVLELPELDSYKFVRHGLWWDVLARSNWTCRSCGRSTKEHGIVLHIDHITPRSRGGKDEIGNLQALCAKCNIGKSNKDDTDLRS